MSLKLNERYPGRFNNPSADYPQGSFKNRTSPTAKDGAYLEQDWANDKEGFFQSLLEAAGVEADGSVDKVGSSQFFDALLAIIADSSVSGSVGAISPMARMTAPVKHLKCNGAPYSRALYPELFQVLVTDAGFTSQAFTVAISSQAIFTRTAHGFSGGERLRLSTTGALPTGLNTTTDYFVDPIDANTFRLLTSVIGGTRITTSGTQSGTHSYLQSWFGLGDGSTTFNVPDERANVLRGLDEGRGLDPGRTLGAQQRGTITAADLQASGAGFSSDSPFAHSQLIANQYGQDLGDNVDWSAFGNTVVLSGTLSPTTPTSTAYLLGRMRMQNGAYPFYIRYEE